MPQSDALLSDGRARLFDRRGAGMLTLTLTPAEGPELPARSPAAALQALLDLLARQVDLGAAQGAELTLFLGSPLAGAELLAQCSAALPGWRVGAAVGALSDPRWPLALRARLPQRALQWH
ncbi:hypothetical protein HNQ51_001195 [Inhella inkyongensis]|uniref:Uncharacterized protein n=1 Tax=Inhella inkyongensis TaxID=392593 RepID=A0A840S2Z6_9BURK|nr:hypothetical protein [Inhella inkyongensis]MBB5203902.1 hypothetical protein [Inhella inkyongensis]